MPLCDPSLPIVLGAACKKYICLQPENTFSVHSVYRDEFLKVNAQLPNFQESEWLCLQSLPPLKIVSSNIECKIFTPYDLSITLYSVWFHRDRRITRMLPITVIRNDKNYCYSKYEFYHIYQISVLLFFVIEIWHLGIQYIVLSMEDKICAWPTPFFLLSRGAVWALFPLFSRFSCPWRCIVLCVLLIRQRSDLRLLVPSRRTVFSTSLALYRLSTGIYHVLRHRIFKIDPIVYVNFVL